MAWFEVDIFKKCITVDLHDYSCRTSLAIAREKIKEAYEHGFKYIRLIHGAANIKEKNNGGSIKFALHGILKRGELDRWVAKGSKEHRLEGGFMLLALRPNPSPVEEEWKEMPLDEF